MDADVKDFFAFIDAAPGHPFVAKPIYEPLCDSVIFYARHERSYGKRLNPLLTLFLSEEDDSLVGCEVKGVQRILKLVGNFKVAVIDSKIRLGLLLAFALAAEPDDPELGQRYAEGLEKFEDIEIDRGELVPA